MNQVFRAFVFSKIARNSKQINKPTVSGGNHAFTLSACKKTQRQSLIYPYNGAKRVYLTVILDEWDHLSGAVRKERDFL
ncbi:MAG: hypothetical protein E6556_04105 [Pantoea sp.]|nr:hypothetical protein [Pantoea sp.]